MLDVFLARDRRARLSIRSFVIVVCAVLFGAIVPSIGVMAQAPGPTFDPVGLQPKRGYFSQFPFETVDMVNGNLLLSFTTLTLPGNAGMNMVLQHSYNRQVVSGGQWFRDTGMPISELLGGLTRSEARAVEQALIVIHGLGRNGGTLRNKINSISKTNKQYAQELERGLALLQSIGYQ